jgi:uncharacterized membrane protein
MEFIKELLVQIAKWIEILGVIILIYGFAKFFIQYLIEEFVKNKLNPPISVLQRIRCKMGVYILLSLDFLIASDIINSITDLSKEQLINLGTMIALRTIIGFFLGKEINELKV